MFQAKNQSDALIDFFNVSARCDEYWRVKSIALNIKPGEHCVILGANGSGKSTLIKLIGRELYPTFIPNKSIKNEILGQQNWEISTLRQHLGIITNDLHNDFLNQGSYLSGFEVVLSGFFGTIGIFDHQTVADSFKVRAYEIIKELNITSLSEKKIGEMSTGELRKCLVARALVHPVQILLLDEPTVGLDLKAQFDFIAMIRYLATKGTTILLVTHHVEEIFPEIQKVVFIKDGEIILQGKKNKVLTSENLSIVFDIPLVLKFANNRYYVTLETDKLSNEVIV